MEENDKKSTELRKLTKLIHLIAEAKGQDPLTVAREMNKKSQEMMKHQENQNDLPSQHNPSQNL